MKPYDKWQTLSKLEIDAATKVINDGQLSLWNGALYDSFCEAASAMSGNSYIIPVNNGTMALTIAGLALGIGKGDEVIIANYGYMASVAPIIISGATAVFANVDSRTLTLSPKDIEDKITEHTKAIIVTHAWGNPADMRSIRRVAQQHNIQILSDSSHAHGVKYENQKLGAWSDISAYSMGLGKLSSGGELGFLSTDSKVLYERSVSLGGVKMTNQLDSIKVPDAVPFKYRPHAVALAVGLESLRRLDEKNVKRRAFARQLFEETNHLTWLHPQEANHNTERVYYRIVFVFNRSVPADAITAINSGLIKAGIAVAQEEYLKPLSTWPNVIQTQFHSPSRFDFDQRLISKPHPFQTLHIWPYTEPVPKNLAKTISSILIEVGEEYGLE